MCAFRVTGSAARPAGRFGSRAAVVVAAASAALVVMAGCAPSPAPTAPPSSPTASPSRTPTIAPEPTTLGEATDAEEALPFFTDAVMGVWATDGQYEGRAYIDALGAAGFDTAAMQVTEDRTAVVGLQADSIQFSVRWGDECLVGQVGPAIGDPVIAVLPGLATGGCLLGETRPIDW